MAMWVFELLFIAHLVYIQADLVQTSPVCGSVDPCQPGGHCVNITNGFMCNCSIGYTGRNCSEEYDPCEVSPCQNSASCRYNRTETRAWCICPTGFTGTYCDSEVLQSKCRDPQTCMNGGTCKDTGDSYICECPYGTSGQICETVCNRSKIDLLLIEDVSPSVTKTEDYDAMKKFERDLLNDTRIDLSAVHVAEVVFGADAKLKFHLRSFQYKSQLLSVIANNSRKDRGPTHLLKPILLASLDVFNEEHGDRTDAKNVVVLFTDGKTKDQSFYAAASPLWKKAAVYVVGLTNEQNLGNLKSVGSGPSYVYSDKQRALKVISNTLAAVKC